MDDAELFKLAKKWKTADDKIKAKAKENEALREQITEEVEGRGVTDTLEGMGIRIHGVQNEYIDYDGVILKDCLTPRQYKSVLADPKVDTKKLADSVAAGRIDPEDVAPAMKTGYSKFFIRITRL